MVFSSQQEAKNTNFHTFVIRFENLVIVYTNRQKFLKNCLFLPRLSYKIATNEKFKKTVNRDLELYGNYNWVKL